MKAFTKTFLKLTVMLRISRSHRFEEFITDMWRSNLAKVYTEAAEDFESVKITKQKNMKIRKQMASEIFTNKLSSV